jgi:hypothetical protein
MALLSNVMFRCLPVKLSRPFLGGSFCFCFMFIDLVLVSYSQFPSDHAV